MPIETLTSLHVAISLVGISSGLLLFIRMIAGRDVSAVSIVFLVTTAATTATGFLYPVSSAGVRHLVGVASLATLSVAVVSLYVFRLAGAWRAVYVIAALVALYFNCSAAVVQACRRLLPVAGDVEGDPQTYILFAQGALLVLFIVLGALVLRMPRERPQRTSAISPL
ncbi:hypothetical protein [Rhodoplanes roseus]|uniref:hypothetical protein n=1 Tax=Rhodoplanes roseus TaxID=29409 RepID=UPI0011B3CCFF|nr:hypothetical protein [Rhodoplanes roseus]